MLGCFRLLFILESLNNKCYLKQTIFLYDSHSPDNNYTKKILAFSFLPRKGNIQYLLLK